MHPRLLLALGLLAATVIAACDDDDPAGPRTTTYTATLSAANEVATTPVASTATGLATFTVSGSTLTYTIGVSGLTTTPTSSHIHLAAAGVNGPIIFNFFPAGTSAPTATTNASFATGTINLGSANVSNVTGFTISGDSLLALLDASAVYVNVHTTRFGAGEIRGQVVRQ